MYRFDDVVKISLELVGEIITEMSHFQHTKQVVFIMRNTEKAKCLGTKILSQYYVSTVSVCNFSEINIRNRIEKKEQLRNYIFIIHIYICNTRTLKCRKIASFFVSIEKQ